MFDDSYLMQLKSEIKSVQDPQNVSNEVRIVKAWKDGVCLSTLVNESSASLQINEVVLFKGAFSVKPDTLFYGEGYNMLSQYSGTLEAPNNAGSYNDHTHYRMPKTDKFWTVYNLMLFSPEKSPHTLMAFTSCNKFRGEIRFTAEEFEVVLDTEGLQLKPGQSLKLEEFYIGVDKNKTKLFDRAAELINANHPQLSFDKSPAGWCSWYCYGPVVTEQNIIDNMNAISKALPQLEYIQIDDGYQAFMGDWLVPGSSFANGIKQLCGQIRMKGLKPAVWVAPFIAEKESSLFREHPGWFVRDVDGNPLPSDRVSFGGWRNGPWYMLDGTHPEAREYLKMVFKTMREEWGCQYFKLDANMWGALPFGKRYDENASSIQAYRMGMEAVLDGAGRDSFVLGCNAPMWPSLGLVHGMRVSNDTGRKWDTMRDVTRQCFLRNWQHRRLWINDPDCVLLDNIEVELVKPDGIKWKSRSNLSESEFLFHATAILATGGMVLSGDILSEISPKAFGWLKKLLPPLDNAAVFDDNSLTVGKVEFDGHSMLYMFNWSDGSKDIEVELPGLCRIEDYWTGEELGLFSGKMVVSGLMPHCARAFVCLKQEYT